MTALDTRALHKGAAPLVHRRKKVRSYRGLPIQADTGVHEFIAGWLEVNRPQEAPVLEVGAGTGALTARLMDRNFEVIPVDRESAPFTRCCPRFIKADLDGDWAPSLPAPGFETIVAMGIIDRLENPKKFIRDLHSLCAAGGEVLVSTPNILCAGSLFEFIRKGTFYGFDPDTYETTGRKSILPPWLIEAFACEAGFAETEVMFIGDLERNFFRKRALKMADRTLRRLRRQPKPVDGFGTVALVRMAKAEM